MVSQFETRYADLAMTRMLDQFGESASYTPYGESASDVTILINDRSRETSDKPGSRSIANTLRASVRVSEVSEINRGDTIQITGDSTVYRIIPASVRRDGLEWHFEASVESVKTLGEVQAFPNR